jgi:phosphoribulokinase
LSKKHPIIAVTGSSGAGTTTVMQSFQHIFRRDGLKAQIVEGDSFHRYNRMEMRANMKEAEAKGNKHYSHFGPYSNLLEELETLFKGYGENGGGRVRKYVHDAGEAAEHGVEPGNFTEWKDIAPEST